MPNLGLLEEKYSLMMVAILLGSLDIEYLAIVPRARVGYEMINTLRYDNGDGNIDVKGLDRVCRSVAVGVPAKSLPYEKILKLPAFVNLCVYLLANFSELLLSSC